MHTHSRMQAQRITKTSGGFTAILCILLAVGSGFLGVFYWPLWIFTALFILGAFAVDRRYYVCARCGNEVAKTSVMCPTCRSQLSSHPASSAMRTLVKLGWFIVTAGVIGAILWGRCIGAH